MLERYLQQFRLQRYIRLTLWRSCGTVCVWKQHNIWRVFPNSCAHCCVLIGT